MKEPISFKLNNRQVRIFESENKNAPIVYANMFMEVGNELIKKSKEINCPEYTLVSVSKIKWDQDLSPWPHHWVIEPNDDFTGGGDDYCKWMLDELIPEVNKRISVEPSYKVIAGYSMAGMFALYVPYLTDYFSTIMSASGSVWYPDFLEFVKSHPFNSENKPEVIYLSLGELEKDSKNYAVSQTQNITEKLYHYYESCGIKTIFQLNPGNHYHEPVLRMAKGIKWTLEQMGKLD